MLICVNRLLTNGNLIEFRRCSAFGGVISPESWLGVIRGFLFCLIR
ncbi:hypothetical protein [Pasteurella sp. 19428wF3_WM03]